MSFFKDKVIAITGGASGIGLATVEILLAEGSRLYVADLNLSGAQHLLQSHPAQIVLVKTDVSSLAQVRAFFQTIRDSGDALYGAVNCAGVNLPGGRLHETTDVFYEKTKGVNFDGVFYCLREELGIMMGLGRGGSIVNLSSGAGIVGMTNAATYCGTKHAVAGLTKAAAMEYAGDGIRINAVAPGATDTPLMRGVIGDPKIMERVLTTIPMGRIAKASEVADFIVYLLSDKSSYITGNVSRVDGAWLAGPRT